MELYKGIITPLVTPFHRDADQSLNEDALKQLVETLIQQGVSGLFVLGSNGEFQTLDHDEKVELTRKTVEFAAGRVPVYAGAGACSTKEAVTLARDLEAAGADAISLISPWFLPLTRRDLLEHFTTVADSIHIPVVLYNMPKATGSALEPDLVRELAAHPRIAAIKDSSGSPELLAAYAEIASDPSLDFHLLVGSDSKISLAYALGAEGAVAGTSNLIPEVLVALDQALQTGDTEKAAVLQQRIEPLRSVLHLGSIPSVLKRAMELRGTAPVGPARLPVMELEPEAEQKVREMLKTYEKS